MEEHRVETAVPNNSYMFAVRYDNSNGWHRTRPKRTQTYITNENTQQLQPCIHISPYTIQFLNGITHAVGAWTIFTMLWFSWLPARSYCHTDMPNTKTWRQMNRRAVVDVLNCHTLGRNLIDVAHAHCNEPWICGAHSKQERKRDDNERQCKHTPESSDNVSRIASKRERERELKIKRAGWNVCVKRRTNIFIFPNSNGAKRSGVQN